MKERLDEIYSLYEPVEIYLKTLNGADWYRGRVVQKDYPGIWVEINEGSHWFVTNRGRIRKTTPDA